MKFEVKSRFSGAVQFTAEIECGEDASMAVKVGLAVKWGVRTGANLSRADLSRADLSGANLSRADLSRADLSRAKGLARERATQLLILLDQPGKIRAYKLVNERNEGPFNGGIAYTSGETVEVDDADTSHEELCGTGIHVATLDWCLKEWRPSYKILIVEFEAKDIACIPTATDGKFRLHRCLVIGEKELDYKTLGLIEE
jgi:hypothetical protein